METMTVRDAMTNRVARVRADASVLEAAHAIALAGSGNLMVVDSSGGFAGVLAAGDILRAAMPDIHEITEAGGSLENAFARFLAKGHELADLPIDPLVIRDPVVLDPDDHVAQAAVVLVERGIRMLPVVRDGRLLGAISRADICDAVVGEAAMPPLALATPPDAG
jgi:predicted transcriptional regulator